MYCTICQTREFTHLQILCIGVFSCVHREECKEVCMLVMSHMLLTSLLLSLSSPNTSQGSSEISEAAATGRCRARLQQNKASFIHSYQQHQAEALHLQAPQSYNTDKVDKVLDRRQKKRKEKKTEKHPCKFNQ